MPLTDVIRAALEAKDLSLRRLEIETGLNRRVLRSFIQGKSAANGATLDKLAEYLRLELRPMDETPPVKKKSPRK